MWIPTMAGIASMVPIRDDDTESNVGAGFGVNAFTVPAGRVLALDWALWQHLSGTAPSVLSITITGAGAGGTARIIHEATPALVTSVFVTNTVWIEEAGVLRFHIEAGDATTDLFWAFAGRLFDWQDVT